MPTVLAWTAVRHRRHREAQMALMDAWISTEGPGQSRLATLWRRPSNCGVNVLHEEIRSAEWWEDERREKEGHRDCSYSEEIIWFCETILYYQLDIRPNRLYPTTSSTFVTWPAMLLTTRVQFMYQRNWQWLSVKKMQNICNIYHSWYVDLRLR